jgi:hypothetical protein
MTSISLLILSAVSIGISLVVWFFVFVLNYRATIDRQLKHITREEFVERLDRYDKTGKYASILGFGTYLISLEFNARELPLIFGPLTALVLAEVYRHLVKQKMRVL